MRGKDREPRKRKVASKQEMASRQHTNEVSKEKKKTKAAEAAAGGWSRMQDALLGVATPGPRHAGSSSRDVCEVEAPSGSGGASCAANVEFSIVDVIDGRYELPA